VAIRANRFALWRQLVGWIALYALVLHAFVAALAPSHVAAHGIGDEASIFCASDAGSMPGGAPAGTQDCDAHCTLARGPGALFVLSLDLASASVVEFVTVAVPWPDEPVPAPTRIRVICEPPRGPPQAA
jgi:hypothetical protein